jgi:hypothetical protein
MVSYWRDNLFISKLFKGLLFLVFLQMFFISYIHAADEPHPYVIFKDDFEDQTANKWQIEIPPNAPEGSSWSILLDEGSNVLSLQGLVDA